MFTSRTALVGLLCAAVVFCGMTTATAQDVDQAKNKLLAKRAAEADAYRKLAETIKGLHITSDTLVRDFVAESDVIKSELDTFIRGVRLGDPTWYEDLSCEVPAEVTVAKVIENLKEIHTRHYQGGTVKGTDFVDMKQQIKKDIIRVVGMGAPRPDLPPDLPEGVEDVITVVASLPPTPPIPALWMKMGPQGADDGQARQRRWMRSDVCWSASRDCGLTVDTLVRDFVTEWDQIETEARGFLVGAYEVKTYYHSDEPIVEGHVCCPRGVGDFDNQGTAYASL